MFGPNDQSPFYFNDPILPAFLDDLSIQTDRTHKIFYGPRIRLKTIGCKNEWINNLASIDHMIQECFDISVITAAYNHGSPHPGPDFDGYENHTGFFFVPTPSTVI